MVTASVRTLGGKISRLILFITIAFQSNAILGLPTVVSTYRNLRVALRVMQVSNFKLHVISVALKSH
jgi:hypothetical protein